MDFKATGRLLCTAKRPLREHSGLLQVIIDNYKEDIRTFAASTEMHRCLGLLPPAGRCKQRDGRGRCRRAVSAAAVVQLCGVHMFTETGDSNIVALRLFRQQYQGVPAWDTSMERQ